MASLLNLLGAVAGGDLEARKRRREKEKATLMLLLALRKAGAMPYTPPQQASSIPTESGSQILPSVPGDVNKQPASLESLINLPREIMGSKTWTLPTAQDQAKLAKSLNLVPTTLSTGKGVGYGRGDVPVPEGFELTEVKGRSGQTYTKPVGDVKTPKGLKKKKVVVGPKGKKTTTFEEPEEEKEVTESQARTRINNYVKSLSEATPMKVGPKGEQVVDDAQILKNEKIQSFITQAGAEGKTSIWILKKLKGKGHLQ